MKNYFPGALFIMLAITACSEDKSSSSETDETMNTMSSGTWRITSFIEEDRNETSNFTGFNFTFDSGDVLTASNGSFTHTGFWYVTSNNSSDDSPDDLDFVIAFPTPAEFAELSDDYEVLSRTSVKLELRHISGGDGSIDYLTFEKN